MRLAFLVNDIATEVDEYTTTRLARAAAQGGHEVWYVGVVRSSSREATAARGPGSGRRVRQRRHARKLSWSASKSATPHGSFMDDLDALFLRNESIDDLHERPWASPVGVVFGQMLKARGVTVANDPMSLMRATSKLYLEEFPEKIRPRSARDARPGSDRAVRTQGRPLRRQAFVRQPKVGTCS